jgi:5-methylthioadenosine/S-adenosylhomocysteine deaminase
MADILIHDGIVVPVDGTNRVIEKGYVAIDGNRISAVGKMEDLGHEKMSDVMIDARGKAVLPGFVNAHTHLATECFRGIVEKLPGIHFTFLVKNYLDDRHICDLSLLGCLELIRFGTTCTGDNYQRSRLIARAIADSGLRGVVSEQISQADLKGSYPAIYTYEPEEAERQIRANEELIREWNGAEGGRITCAFGPHAPDTLTQELLMEIRTKAEEQDVGVMIHLAQSQGVPREDRYPGAEDPGGSLRPPHAKRHGDNEGDGSPHRSLPKRLHQAGASDTPDTMAEGWNTEYWPRDRQHTT